MTKRLFLVLSGIGLGASLVRGQQPLTPEMKQQILWRQHDACAICGYEFGQKLGDYHIDHCHQTDIVRGILCDRCNRGLGYFRDTPDFLRQAANYLTPQGNTSTTAQVHQQ